MAFPLIRLIKFSFKDFRRNVWLSIITIIVIILALLSVNFLLTLNVLANTAVKSVQDKIDISVYFKPQTSEGLVKAAREELLALPQVKDVSYVSNEEALSNFKKRHQDNPLLMESLGELAENPLGHALVVTAKDPADYSAILSALDKVNFSDSVQSKNYNDYQQIIAKLNQIADKVNQFGLAVISIFAAIAALVVFNTIRVTIYARREEIGIMRLVGATNGIIRTPFILESIFYALVAWAVTTLVFYQLLKMAHPYLMALLGETGTGFADYFRGNFSLVFGGQLLALILLNILSSVFAIRKYLKV